MVPPLSNRSSAASLSNLGAIIAMSDEEAVVDDERDGKDSEQPEHLKWHAVARARNGMTSATYAIHERHASRVSHRDRQPSKTMASGHSSNLGIVLVQLGFNHDVFRAQNSQQRSPAPREIRS